MITKRFKVEGLVQGVFYRANTQIKARELRLTGFARNEDDGSVLVEVYGEPGAIEALKTWLWEGPPTAEVTKVTEIPCEDRVHTDFSTL